MFTSLGLCSSRDTAPDAISLTARGSSRCSTACTWASIAAMSRAYGSSNASCRITGPLSTPSSTKWTVTPMTRTP